MVKIAIIGAGSSVFSSRVVMDLALTPGLRSCSVALMDVDEHRLDVIHRLAVRASNELGADLNITKTLERAEALEGADFVINTALNGGHDWHEAQRNLFEKHGYYRGAGSVDGDASLAGMGNMLLMLDIARSVERICPDAWMIQSSNPVFEGCTLVARETGVKIVGLCHGHYGYRGVANVLGLSLEHVSVRVSLQRRGCLSASGSVDRDKGGGILAKPQTSIFGGSDVPCGDSPVQVVRVHADR